MNMPVPAHPILSGINVKQVAFLHDGFIFLRHNNEKKQNHKQKQTKSKIETKA